MKINVDKKTSLETFSYLVIAHCIVFQIISFLRATSIYNTSYLANLSNIVISLFMLVNILQNINKLNFKFTELILITIPIIYIILGIIVNGFNRDLLSDTYTSIFFILLIIYIRLNNFQLSIELQNKFANWMSMSLFISIIIYKIILPILGIKVYTIGITSIFYIFPLVVFFTNKSIIKFIFHLMLLLIASKRGVLLSGIITIFIASIGNKKIKVSTKIISVILIVIISVSTILITLTPSSISQFPQSIYPVLYKTMKINPFSQYNEISTDARVLEAISALKPVREEPIYMLSGKGPGYTYTVYDENGAIRKENTHNSHFSPVTIYTRYGVVYTIALYGFILLVIFKNYNLLNRGKLNKNKEALLLYTIAAFFNSFTAFTIYIDYIFILSLGILAINKE